MKTIRFKKGKLKLIGFSNFLVSYRKNILGNYRLEIKTPFDGISIPLWYSKKKPYFRNINIIAFLIIPLVPPVVIGSIIVITIAMYSEGAINFIRDSACVNHVRFFGYTNIITIIILLLVAFLN